MIFFFLLIFPTNTTFLQPLLHSIQFHECVKHIYELFSSFIQSIDPQRWSCHRTNCPKIHHDSFFWLSFISGFSWDLSLLWRHKLWHQIQLREGWREDPFYNMIEEGVGGCGRIERACFCLLCPCNMFVSVFSVSMSVSVSVFLCYLSLLEFPISPTLSLSLSLSHSHSLSPLLSKVRSSHGFSEKLIFFTTITTIIK